MRDSGYDVSLITREGIDALLHYLPYFSNRSTRFGTEASVIAACVFPSSLTGKSIEFNDACYEHNFVQDFDWGEWSQSRQRLISSGEGIEDLDLAGIGRLLTAHFRGDHFCDGHLINVMSSGQMARILRRLAELREIRTMPQKDTTNLFSTYKQRENHFTNGLIGVLKLVEIEDPAFIPTFFKQLLHIEISSPLTSAQVLEGYAMRSTADAVLEAKNTALFLETKIVSATLRCEQIQKHLADLDGAAEELQYLVLLTPDDSHSTYIRGYLDLDATRIKHLEWRRVYEYLSRYQYETRVLRSVVKQYLSTIRDMIFEQDIVGIISKVSFGEHSEVYADCYLDEMRAGKWTKWNTPNRYKNLDGTGRKLLLYDKERKAITVEVEIARVEETNEEKDYPFTNWFAANTLKVLRTPVSDEAIESVGGFENFTHERAPYRNITHEQYSLLGIDT